MLARVLKHYITLHYITLLWYFVTRTILMWRIAAVYACAACMNCRNYEGLYTYTQCIRECSSTLYVGVVWMLFPRIQSCIREK